MHEKRYSETQEFSVKMYYLCLQNNSMDFPVLMPAVLQEPDHALGWNNTSNTVGEYH